MWCCHSYNSWDLRNPVNSFIRVSECDVRVLTALFLLVIHNLSAFLHRVHNSWLKSSRCFLVSPLLPHHGPSSSHDSSSAYPLFSRPILRSSFLHGLSIYIHHPLVILCRDTAFITTIFFCAFFSVSRFGFPSFSIVERELANLT